MTENREILYDDWAVREITKPRIRDIILFSGVLLLLFVIVIAVVASLVSDGLWAVALVCFLWGVYGFLNRKHSHLIISEGEIVITNWLKSQKRYEVELSTLTLKISSMACLIWILLVPLATSNTTVFWPSWDLIVFSVTRGRTIMSLALLIT